MKLDLNTFTLSLVSTALALPVVELDKRNPTVSFELVAYGITSSYIRFFYSDGTPYLQTLIAPCFIMLINYPGLAYAGDSSLWTYGSVTADVTCEP